MGDDQWELLTGIYVQNTAFLVSLPANWLTQFNNYLSPPQSVVTITLAPLYGSKRDM